MVGACPRGLNSAGRGGTPASRPVSSGRTIGPGATRRGTAITPAGTRFNWRAVAGVTPSVATVGRSGCCPISGWVDPSARPGNDRAAQRTGRDPVRTLAGTEVAADRLTKPLTSIGRSIAAGPVTWPVLIRRE